MHRPNRKLVRRLDGNQHRVPSTADCRPLEQENEEHVYRTTYSEKKKQECGRRQRRRRRGGVSWTRTMPTQKFENVALTEEAVRSTSKMKRITINEKVI